MAPCVYAYNPEDAAHNLKVLVTASLKFEDRD